VFVEVTEKRLFLGFRFPGSANLELAGAERRSQRKNCSSEHQHSAGVVWLDQSGSQMEILA
jgi:hypothetical protein